MSSIADRNENEIILCQPDSRKGCSLCCGLFNFRDISKESLLLFLGKGVQRELSYKSYEDYIEPAEVRDKGSHVCPFQGFLSPGKPGCLLHPLYCGEERRGRSLFSEKICGNFLCPAHYILTDAEKKGLVKYVNDWYLYSVAIADPLFFSEVYKKSVAQYCKDMEEVNIISFIGAKLEEHGEKMSRSGAVLFNYSVSEYSCGRLE